MGRYSDYLIVSDFDMTLTDLNHNIVDRNIEALKDYIAQDGAFTIATGRAIKGFSHLLPYVPVNAPCIYSNGGLTYDHVQDKAVEVHEMPPQAEQLIEVIVSRFPEVGMEMYQQDDEVFVINPNGSVAKHMEIVKLTPTVVTVDKIKRPWIKVVLAGENAHLIEACEHINREFGDYLYAVVSLPFLMDIQGKSVSKGTAARKLLNRMGRKTLVCAGDAENDLAMLKEADIAFIPENAHPSVQGYGFRQVCHCDEGSIADVISKLE